MPIDPRSPETTGYHLFFEPKGQIKHVCDSLIATLAKTYQGPVFDSHITVLARIEHGTDEEVIETARQLSFNVAAFSTRVEAIESEAAYFRALYYRVTPEPTMSYHKLAAAAFGMQPHETFKPHLSLYYGLIEEKEWQTVIDSVPENAVDTIVIDTISVYRTPGAVATWKKVAEFPLRGTH